MDDVTKLTACPHLYARFNPNGGVGFVYCAMCGDREFGLTLTDDERKRVPSINDRTDGPDSEGWWQYESELSAWIERPV